MIILHEVDKPGSDVDHYVDNLDGLLGNKVNLIQSLRGFQTKFDGGRSFKQKVLREKK